MRHNGSEVYNGGTFIPGHGFRIEVVSGVVRFFKNRALGYTNPNPPAYPLLFDTALYNPDAKIRDVGLVDSPPCRAVDGTLADSDQVCRGAEGPCDAPEFCPGDSEMCPPDQAVADGAPCGDGFCAAGACHPHRAEGTGCSFGWQCASQRCFAGACAAPCLADGQGCLSPLTLVFAADQLSLEKVCAPWDDPSPVPRVATWNGGATANVTSASAMTAIVFLAGSWAAACAVPPQNVLQITASPWGEPAIA